MTNEEFDLKLRDKINSALENEQEEFTAASWDKFEEKLLYSERKKRFASILRIAATVLIFVAGGVSLFIVYNQFSSDTNTIAQYDPLNKKTITDTSSMENKISGSFINNDAENASRKYNYYSSKTASKRDAVITVKDDNAIAANENSIAQNNPPVSDNADSSPASGNAEAVNQSVLVKTDSSVIPANAIAAAGEELPSAVNELKLPSLGKQFNGSVRFGANVSSIVNYDQANSSSKLNIGGGVFVEIPLLKNLVVYSGVSLTNQTINYQNSTVQTMALGKHVKSKDLKLTGLDIPVNLKYRFNIADADLFVSTGFSSLTFFNESIETKYGVNTLEKGYGVSVMQTVTREEVETNSLGSFNDFFFAKIFNISFGVELPINSRNLLLIEPYLKYSAGPLKSVKAYPSMFGVNLGIVF